MYRQRILLMYTDIQTVNIVEVYKCTDSDYYWGISMYRQWMLLRYIDVQTLNVNEVYRYTDSECYWGISMYRQWMLMRYIDIQTVNLNEVYQCTDSVYYRDISIHRQRILLRYIDIQTVIIIAPPSPVPCDVTAAASTDTLCHHHRAVLKTKNFEHVFRDKSTTRQPCFKIHGILWGSSGMLYTYVILCH